MITFHIISLFPESIRAYTDASILGRAQKSKKIKVLFYNPRDFSTDKHKRVDRKPYGGGPGMVLEAGPVLKAVEKACGRKKKVKILFFAASGKEFNASYAKNLLKKYKHVILIAGHYEGIDARVQKILKAEEVSVGPFILTGGEVPALVVVDAVSRFVSGVLGNITSLEESRTASPDVYTRPEVLFYKGRNYKVPKILLSGHHKEIEGWKQTISKKKRRT